VSLNAAARSGSSGESVSDDFVKAGRVGDLAPGKMMRVEIAGRRILLANVDGRFYATADTCTHEDASLSSGSLRGELVRCPLHGSRFNVCTGRVMEEPAEQDLQTYPVRVEGDHILVGLNGPSTR
jgi:3-phenylpropionate/trans-cinnamate dioxygenase ferredoxin component